jgi:hypothetical protein
VGMVFAVRVASLNDPLTKGLSDHLFCNKPSHNAGAAQVFGILSSVLLSTGLL